MASKVATENYASLLLPVRLPLHSRTQGNDHVGRCGAGMYVGIEVRGGARPGLYVARVCGCV